MTTRRRDGLNVRHPAQDSDPGAWLLVLMLPLMLLGGWLTQFV